MLFLVSFEYQNEFTTNFNHLNVEYMSKVPVVKTESCTNNQRRFSERSIINIKQQSVKYDVTSALIVTLKLYSQTSISPNTP